ncbi:uncharacterized protein LOC121054926 [Oryza brachyantha]|uniref:uncharacterized protein LOC121054926 n=1 Tax=Oryza brachyantha TaxID=4533 RepID=UPI001ADC8990|nr:uncharacterized protein LOC121054926 [Oryza brachyantha]
MASTHPYRFPVPAEGEPRRRSAAQSCGTCGASAVASCVALCCCPCAVVSCLTLAFVKAPYLAGRRCAARLASKRRRRMMVKQGGRPGATPRKTNRVWDLDDDQQEWRPDGGGGGGAVQEERKDRRSPGPGDASDAAVGEGSGRVRSRVDAAEKTWVEIYQLGHWGFGRLSSSSRPQVISGDADSDGVAAGRH